ncbi:uncharacterized protein FIBRA_09129 [Fibroporia radiculosa]|uniref:Uncharacterized protein n=1 Tax=Fibroporia radiculosa TaxID=599839 RepID=J4ICQ6_9APHY|nr:uncharacterized protein FIBRA_09129 [Fibroporia radiculosa]CCM06826.1 predicted protein [Fibroporia radiculosa]
MTPYKNYSPSSSSTASITILTALLLFSWFFTALLILLLTFTIFVLKDNYTFKVHLELNQVAPLAATTLTVVDKHPHLLLLTLLSSFLITLLSILTLALIVPLTLRTTI